MAATSVLILEVRTCKGGGELLTRVIFIYGPYSAMILTAHWFELRRLVHARSGRLAAEGKCSRVASTFSTRRSTVRADHTLCLRSRRRR